MFSDQSPNAHILEKARCYRRLLHLYSMHGKPMPWKFVDDAGKDQLVFVNPVDAGKAWKLSIVNLSHESRDVKVKITLPLAGTFEALRYGDGETVVNATQTVSLTATPDVTLHETLAAGETVEYLIRR
jgi:hypothetical protein